MMIMLKRQIAIGDIHGCYDLLKELIEEVIRFDPSGDMLIFLGDYIDRGEKSREVVEYVLRLRERHPDAVILLKGNHEALAYNALTAKESRKEMVLWRLNGGDKTIASYVSASQAKECLIPFIESLELFYETDTHIFVHGGIPYGQSLITVTPEDLLWDRSFSYKGEKVLIIGHTPKSEVATFNQGKIICVDTGAYMTGVLSAYDTVNDKVYRAE